MRHNDPKTDVTLPTAVDAPLPWAGPRGARVREALHVVIAWSLDEPDRIGEVAALDATETVLGRGGPQPDDRAPRATFHRVRPGASTGGAPLSSQRISRSQLRFERTSEAEGDAADDAVVVKNVGKTQLLMNGGVIERATLRHGDVLVLKNAMVLLVVKRARSIEPSRVFDRPFPFGRPDPFGVVGESPATWSLRESLAIAAKTPQHVLVQGDSGAGKELAARTIHALSARAQKTLVTRNAATFPEGLVDAELFGSAKNYPNSGSPERPGIIGEADGSTLFLDEIGELPHSMQAHLLRVLDQGGEYQRLGESRMRKVDLRLVAATNRSLDALKHDFAARLTMRVHVPGLDERTEDIPLLVRHLLDRAAETSPEIAGRFMDRDGAKLDPALMEALLRHPYSTHLRELDRLLWTALSSSRGDFIEKTREVDEALAKSVKSEEPAARTAEPTEDELRAALANNAGSVTRAARALGLKNRWVLYRLLEKHGLEAGK